MSERMYTESEMQLERAAWQREAADEVNKWQYVEKIRDAILAIPTDQPALDRHDAELLADFVQRTFPPTPGGYVSATEAKAQTAAILEKAAEVAEQHTDLAIPPNTARDAVRALIPADHAAALTEKVQQGKRDTWEHVFQGIEEPCGCENHRQLAERVQEEVGRLRAVCAEAYQFAGVYNAPIKVLDNLAAAASGKPVPHETFLPVILPDERRKAVAKAKVDA